MVTKLETLRARSFDLKFLRSRTQSLNETQSGGVETSYVETHPLRVREIFGEPLIVVESPYRTLDGSGTGGGHYYPQDWEEDPLSSNGAGMGDGYGLGCGVGSGNGRGAGYGFGWGEGHGDGEGGREWT